MAQQTPGMKCPKCGTFIATTISELLTASGLTCPNCRLVLTINREESKKAMEILENAEKVEDRKGIEYF